MSCEQRLARTARKSAGFSLIELLVVVAIISVLIAIILPAIGKAREQAKTIQCATQLRQLGQAFHNYAATNRGYLPPHVPADGACLSDETSPDYVGPAWTSLLARYLGYATDRPIAKSPVYHCPAYLAVSERHLNYFLSARWMRKHNPILLTMQLSSIRSQATFVLSGDCTAAEHYPPPFGTSTHSDDPNKNDGEAKCLTFFGEPDGFSMHRQGNNVLFPDGHVATFRTFESAALTYSPHSNQDWHEVDGN
jgi:prepilin-type N-terminal cleavage/methylation domain-containing protein/prepilin-type processing-associated H-X9-DG protein